jgi:hypothetical protein
MAGNRVGGDVVKEIALSDKNVEEVAPIVVIVGGKV